MKVVKSDKSKGEISATKAQNLQFEKRTQLKIQNYKMQMQDLQQHYVSRVPYGASQTVSGFH